MSRIRLRDDLSLNDGVDDFNDGIDDFEDAQVVK